MRISVLVPTYKRVEKLKKCLLSLSQQTFTPYEIIVIFRDDDTKTQSLLNSFQEKLPLKTFTIKLAGVVHAENLAIEKASGDLLSFIDDDGYAPVDWCEKIHSSFVKNPHLVALGGPDNIIGDEALRKEVSQFGKITWYAKLIGNHHHKGVGIHEVDVLKGVNMTIKREVMPKLDPLLSSERFKGNGCHWELDVFLRIKKKYPHYQILFDTDLEVQHESQHSDIIIKENHRNNARNMTYVYLKNLGFLQNFIHIIYLVFIGHARIPGVLKTFQFVVKKDDQVMTKLVYAWHGVWQGFLLYSKREKS